MPKFSTNKIVILTVQIEVIKGDITTLAAGAIVNAANTSLMGGGGVDGAIHRAGGKEILEACKKIAAKQGGCATGEAVITTAGKLPAKYVIHTVGPVWHGGGHDEAILLKNCYTNVLKLAELHALKHIAFPNISTGIYRFPKGKAAEIAVDAVMNYKPGTIEKVTFVCFDEENYQLYLAKVNSK